MNKIERWIYNKVRYNQKIKKKLVYIYQVIFSSLTKNDSIAPYPIVVREGFFFGFHDKIPWSPDNTKLLAHRYTKPLMFPKPSESVDVGYFTGKKFTNFKRIGDTNTWNWQMGSMLQWLGNSNKIIFNDWDGSKHVARIFDTNGTEEDRISNPVAAVDPSGKFAISLSFNRLREGDPAYGYSMGSEPELSANAPSSSGMYLINLSVGKHKLLYSVQSIRNFEPTQSMNDAYHYFSHPLFSPSGERFVFFHRWKTKTGQIWTRMFSTDRDGYNLHLFRTNGTVTHIAWKDDYSIMAYANKKEHGDKYYLFQDRSDEYTIIGENIFQSDGHPQFSPNGTKLITDTYPDRFRKQRLILFDLKSEKREDIATLYSPIEYWGEVRCDLHPRWDRNGNMLCFDSSHTGVRALCTINLRSQ